MASVVNPQTNPLINPAADPINMASEVRLTDVVQYKQPAFKGGRYRYVHAAQEKSAALTFNLNSIQEYNYLVPGMDVSNLGFSEFDASLTIPAQGANNMSYVHNGFLNELSYVKLQSVSRRVNVVDLKNIPEFTKTCWAATISHAQFMHMPVHTPNAQTAAAVLSPGSKFHRVQSLTLVADATPANAKYGGFDVGDDAKITEARANDPIFGISNAIGADGTRNKAINYRIRLKLNTLPHTWFSLNKDMAWGQDMRLVLGFNMAKNFGAFSTSAVDNATAYAAAVSFDLTTLPTIAAGTTPNLYLALQEDIILQRAALDALANGIRMRIPTVESYVETLGNAGLQKITRKIAKADGNNLLRVYTTIADATNTGLLYCNISNLASSRWSDIYTKLDGKPLQDGKLLHSDFEPYLWLRERFEDSVYQNELDYMRRCIWVDDFSGVKKSVDWCKFDNAPSGLPLIKDYTYNVEITTDDNNSLLYQFFVIQKDLIITSDAVNGGIEVL